MRIRPLLLVAALAVALPGAAHAGATVSIDAATLDSGVATVSGHATFTPVTEPVDVHGDNVQFEVPEVADPAGIDLQAAHIQRLPNGLRFIWTLKSLPPVVPPEGVRYTWSFKIGANQYQLQAKRTNLASITTLEDPVNHAVQLPNDYFQLRGACQASYRGTPTSGCFHLAFLSGAFNAEAKTVSIDLPFQTRDSIGRIVAPDFTPGVIIDENQTAGMSITAAFQAVIGNTSTSDYINAWDQYFVGPIVQLGVGPAAARPSAVLYTSNATIAADGSFSGTVSGFTATNNTVFARACDATECSYATLTL